MVVIHNLNNEEKIELLKAIDNIKYYTDNMEKGIRDSLIGKKSSKSLETYFKNINGYLKIINEVKRKNTLRRKK